MKISDYLNTGKAQAVPLDCLRSYTGLDGRAIRKLINAERLHGTPILSDNATGYYLARNEAERAEFVRSMKHRAGEIWKVAQAVEDGGMKNDGQLRIDRPND